MKTNYLHFIFLSVAFLSLSISANATQPFTFVESFENAQSDPGSIVNTVAQGTGGDGVYALSAYDGFLYENRRIYIEDYFVHSSNRSLKHRASRDNYVSSYTGVEASISPGPGDFDPQEGDEMWARMMIYIPLGTDWRTGADGTSSVAGPKLFRVFWKSDRWLTTYLQVSRGGYFEPSWYKNQYPTGVAVGIRFEVDHDDAISRPMNYGTACPWTISGSISNFTYVAPTDNNYENFIIPYGKWVCLEHYTYFDSNESKGKSRFWLDEKLVYEQTIDTWTSQVRDAPWKVVQIMSVATWEGIPTTSTTYFTDDYMITNNPESATKTDAFGNKMIGRPSSEGGDYSLKVSSGTGSGKYDENDVVNITPYTLTGKEFNQWTGDTQYLISPVTTANNNITMPADNIEVTATYNDILYTLTVENGSGDGAEYIYQQVVNIAADSPPTGYEFDQWTGDVACITNVNDSATTVTMAASNVSVTATYVPVSPPVVIIEAEDGTLVSPMESIADGNASGGYYIRSTTVNSGSATYTVNIAVDGKYKIIGNVKTATNGESNSFFIQIDQQPEVSWHTVNSDGNWVEADAYIDWELTQLYEVELTAGNHIIVISGREINTNLDYFYLKRIGLSTHSLALDKTEDEEKTIYIYPNPSSTMLTVTGFPDFDNNAKIEMYSLPGRKVYETTQNIVFPHELDISSLQPGKYIIRVWNSDKVETVKFCKQ